MPHTLLERLVVDTPDEGLAPKRTHLATHKYYYVLTITRGASSAMSSESLNFIPEPYKSLPRAAVALAAFSVLAAGCSSGETSSASPTSATQSAESHTSDMTDKGHVPSPTHSEQNGQSHNASKEAPQSEQQNPTSKSDKSSNTPASTSSPDIASLIFKVTGSCHMDGELENWSKNFTPYGSTHNEVIQPDGTMYEGVINDQVDGLGHSQWSVTCSDFAQEGDYKGLITDLGPDNTYGTADDRSVPYTFGISNS